MLVLGRGVVVVTVVVEVVVVEVVVVLVVPEVLKKENLCVGSRLNCE